jgi:hypothetical protein
MESSVVGDAVYRTKKARTFDRVLELAGVRKPQESAEGP